MDRRPPLAVSPRRLRPRRGQHSTSSISTTPPASIKKTQLPIRSSTCSSPLFQPEFNLVSSELTTLAKRTKEQLGKSEGLHLGTNLTASIACNTSPLFERGRFYELYSARRNERLKRKKGEIAEETVGEDPGIAVELAKRRSSKKAESSVRKSVPTDFSFSRVSSLRSSVRSSKEMKKISSSVFSEKSAAIGKRMATRSSDRKK
ncbi:uncharacterized protein [Typha angustifolia]|uniref:uncharacterized protein n=1 Tax=Typha angustifolia TaxID=59011 RepID=UPI003C2AB787